MPDGEPQNRAGDKVGAFKHDATRANNPPAELELEAVAAEAYRATIRAVQARRNRARALYGAGDQEAAASADRASQ